MFHMLLEYCQSQQIPGFEHHGDLPETAWNFHQDLSFLFLVYSPRNVGHYARFHPHYFAAYETMQDNNMLHQFCEHCNDVTCLVNSTMLRIIHCCMYYLEKVFS